MKNLGPRILKLRSLGYSYNKIVFELQCSKATVAYHCGIGQKAKTRYRNDKDLFVKTLGKKVNHFKHKYCSSHEVYINKNKTFGERLNKKIRAFSTRNTENKKHMFTIKQLRQKLESNPFCELTGRKIDIYDTQSWHLDHKIPASRGGENTFENAAILCKSANEAKGRMTNEEFLELCKDALIHHGYNITKT